MSQGNATPSPTPPGKEAERSPGHLVFFGVVTAISAIVVWRLRRPRAPQAVSARRRSSRNLEVARLGASVGVITASSAARKVFASAERRIEIDTEREMRTAQEIAESLGNMKGALMKLAQMAGFVDEGLPEPLRVALSQLQSQAPPMAGELAAEVIVNELGKRPDELFLEWDPVPIAAASIGQVHRALWLDPATGTERAVAVKVQYPGIDEAIRADLANTSMVGGMLSTLFKGLDPAPMVAELRLRIGEELDYINEATNQRFFAEQFRGHPFIHIPAVIDSLSTARVLTSELSTGVRFDELLTWDQTERDMAGESIFRFVFRSLYQFNAFNGDPHPGNYLFHPGGKVTFLDFGLVKRFTIDEMHLFQDMISAAVLKPDWDEYRRLIEEAGLLRKGAPATTEEARDYFALFYDFVRNDDNITWTPAYSSHVTRNLFDRSSPIAQYATVPPAFVVIQRINLGLYGVLGQLNASGNYRRIAEELWPMTKGPASTPMGRLEHAWLASRNNR